jgi:hypothetical protein
MSIPTSPLLPLVVTSPRSHSGHAAEVQVNHELWGTALMVQPSVRAVAETMPFHLLPPLKNVR